MTIKQTVLFLVNLVLSVGSVVMFGDTMRLIAEWRVGVLSGIFIVNACILAAVVFAYRAGDAKENGPLSIVAPHKTH